MNLVTPHFASSILGNLKPQFKKALTVELYSLLDIILELNYEIIHDFYAELRL
jgi:hypothetical protein